MAADGALQAVRPVHQRGQELGGGKRQPDHGSGREVPLFQQGVGEMGGSHHDRVNPGVSGQVGQQSLQRGNDAGGNIARGGGLDRGNQPCAVHQDGIGIGPANVNANKQGARRYTERGTYPVS